MVRRDQHIQQRHDVEHLAAGEVLSITLLDLLSYLAVSTQV
jgi:hypothetical protein